MKRRKKYLKIFILISTFAVLGAVFLSPWWIANSKNAQRRALAFVERVSGWQINVAEFNWSPFKGKFEAAAVNVQSKDGSKKISAQGAKISYRLLGLLRGRLVIEDIEANNVIIELPEDAGVKEKIEKKRRLDIARLILIKKIEIRNGRVEGISVNRGDVAISAGEVQFTVLPSILGDTKLKFSATELGVLKGEKEMVSAGEAEISASTELSKWRAHFPFINAVEGSLEGRGIRSFGVNVEELGAGVSYLDGNIDLEDLAVRIGENTLEGKLRTEELSGKVELEVSVPNPIKLPYIGSDLETIDTAGEFWGKIKYSGTGITPLETKGVGSAELNYRFNVSPQAPLALNTGFVISDGVVTLKDAKAIAGADTVSLGGIISIRGKKIKIEASGERFPVEHVFDKFKNPHLNKIFGATDFSGTFEGWGKEFIAKVNAVVFGGGWKPVVVERANAELEATYNDLKLNGTIFSGEKETGNAKLSIHFGPKVGDNDRDKKIELEGSVHDHPVGESLSEWGLLSGSGTGEIKLTGPITAIKGSAQGAIEKGNYHGIDFDHAATKLEFIKHKLVFSGMEVTLERSAKAILPGNLEADIDPEKVRFHGEPAAGLSVDAAYKYSDMCWSIKNISWESEESGGRKITAAGTAVSGGDINLKIDGSLNLSDVARLGFLNAGSGPVDVVLDVRGKTSEPKPTGTIKFYENTLVPKGEEIALEELNGVLKFDASKIFLEGISAKVDDGDVKISGNIDHKGFEASASDLKLEGRGMRYRSEDGSFYIEFDGAISLKGQFPSPVLKGELTILDGKYTKDFTLIDAIAGKKASKVKDTKSLPMQIDPKLELKARTTGDFLIRNNVGDIYLNIDVGVRGTKANPVVSGTIDALGGKVHYLGLEFEITKGFVEFKERYEKPYIEVYAQREVGTYNVNLEMRGQTDNLVLDLSATSPTGVLDKKDAVSLIMFGVTETQRSAIAAQAGSQFTSTLVGQAVTGIIGQPIMRATHLDVFRFEASASGTNAVSRIYIGKQISDRLSFNFAADINSVNAVQTLIGEYLVTDNLLFIGSRASDASYLISGALRFRIR